MVGWLNFLLGAHDFFIFDFCMVDNDHPRRDSHILERATEDATIFVHRVKSLDDTLGLLNEYARRLEFGDDQMLTLYTRKISMRFGIVCLWNSIRSKLCLSLLDGV